MKALVIKDKKKKKSQIYSHKVIKHFEVVRSNNIPALLNVVERCCPG
jgi:hypothetical protein